MEERIKCRDGRTIPKKCVDNLKPVKHILTREDQVKGGKASAIKKEERKTMREDLLFLLSTEGVQIGLLESAIDTAMSGNIKALEFIRDTIGERPTETIDTTVEIVTSTETETWGK